MSVLTSTYGVELRSQEISHLPTASNFGRRQRSSHPGKREVILLGDALFRSNIQFPVCKTILFFKENQGNITHSVRRNHSSRRPKGSRPEGGAPSILEAYWVRIHMRFAIDFDVGVRDGFLLEVSSSDWRLLVREIQEGKSSILLPNLYHP